MVSVSDFHAKNVMLVPSSAVYMRRYEMTECGSYFIERTKDYSRL